MDHSGLHFPEGFEKKKVEDKSLQFCITHYPTVLWQWRPPTVILTQETTVLSPLESKNLKAGVCSSTLRRTGLSKSPPIFPHHLVPDYFPSIFFF